MIQANELRIGNYIEHEKNNLIIYSISTDGVVCHFNTAFLGSDIDKIKPIPLTEEWLLNFGFDYEFGEWKIILGYDFGEFAVYKNDYDEEKYWLICLDDTYHIDKDIEYVHQLQNLYFALTGEELKIK